MFTDTAQLPVNLRKMTQPVAADDARNLTVTVSAIKEPLSEVRKLLNAPDPQRVVLIMELFDRAKNVGATSAPQTASSGHGGTIRLISFDEVESDTHMAY